MKKRIFKIRSFWVLICLSILVGSLFPAIIVQGRRRENARADAYAFEGDPNQEAIDENRMNISNTNPSMSKYSRIEARAQKMSPTILVYNYTAEVRKESYAHERTSASFDLVALEAYLRDQPRDEGNIVDTPDLGQAVYFHQIFRVDGSGYTPTCRCELRIDGSRFCYVDYSFEAGWIWIMWCNSPWTAECGSHTLTGVLDTLSQVDEFNEGNNQASDSWDSGPCGEPDIRVEPDHLEFDPPPLRMPLFQNGSDYCNCSSNLYPVMKYPPPMPDPTKSSPKPEVLVSLPSQFNWRDYEGGDWTTPAKSQGGCGSCWDFAALGALDAVINIKYGTPTLDLDLSEQYVLSCLPAAGDCDGGSSSRAFMYILSEGADGNYVNGIIPESCFPYQADDTIPCTNKCPDWESHLIPISNYGYWYPSLPTDRYAIRSQLIEKGPIVTYLTATDDFISWGSTHHNPDDYYPYPGPVGDINHAVVIVGYKDDLAIGNGGYWIIKNSWGTGFGYEGFYNVEYDSLRHGEFITYVEYEPEEQQPITVYNDGTGSLEVYNIRDCYTTGEPSGWLSASPTAFTVPPGGSQTVIVTVNPTGLDSGTYHGWLEIDSNDPDIPEENPYIVTVTLTVKPTTCTVTFYTNPIADSPSITFDGDTYTHGQSRSYSPSDYSATANPPSADYSFHHWDYSGSSGTGVYVPNININPTTVQVRGDGWLKAIFSAKIIFHANPAGIGSITYDGSTFTDGDFTWEANLPPDYGNNRTIHANVPTGYIFISWATTGKIYVSDSSEADTTLTVEGPGALTANFQSVEYDVTIKAHCDSEEVDVSVSFTWDGTPYTTPKTFIDRTGSHEVVIDERDANGHPFVKWLKDGTDYSIDRTITISSGGNYTAIYEAITIYDFTTCNEDGNAKTTFQRTETVYICFSTTYPNASSVTTGSATPKIQLSTDDGVTWTNKTTLIATYDAGKGKWFTATGYKIGKDEPYVTAPSIEWRALLLPNTLDDGNGNKGPCPKVTSNFSLNKADLNVTITDGMIPDQTYQRTQTTATVEFNITYPDESHFTASDLGQITVTITDGTNNYTFQLSAADYSDTTKKWSALWRIPKDATLSTRYKFKITADDMFDSVSPNPNIGPPVNISDVNTFSVVKADLTVTIVNQPATSYSRGQNASFDIRIQYPNLSNLTVADIGTTGIIETKIYYNTTTLMATIRIDSTNASTYWNTAFNGFTICWYIPADAPLSTSTIKYEFKIEQDGMQDTVATPNTGPASLISSDPFDVTEAPTVIVQITVDKPYPEVYRLGEFMSIRISFENPGDVPHDCIFVWCAVIFPEEIWVPIGDPIPLTIPPGAATATIPLRCLWEYKFDCAWLVAILDPETYEVVSWDYAVWTYSPSGI